MSWSRYEPPRTRALPSEPVGLFERGAANGPHPWHLGRPDPGPSIEVELAALREQARSEGLAQALAEARAIAEAEVEKVRQRWDAAVDALVRQTLEVADERRREMCELALAVAEAVVQRELERGDAIAGLVEAGMTALGHDVEAGLALAPVDVERVGERLRERWPQLVVRGDASLAVGSVKLESRGARLATSLADRIAQARALVLGEPAPGETP